MTLPAIFATQSNVDFGIQLQLALLVVVLCSGCMGLAVITGFRKEDWSALRSE